MQSLCPHWCACSDDNHSAGAATDTSDETESDEQDGAAQNSKGSKQQQAILLALKKGKPVKLLSVSPEQHFTRPPPRYTEASLVKALEQHGIGRPSTYAAILKVLQVTRCLFFPPPLYCHVTPQWQ